ncbi:MAG: copper amine oxidase N-terminal domain-containing protein [Aminipila sp.]
MKNFKLLILTLALILLLIPCSASAASKPINVTINGEAVKWTDTVPYVDSNNRTMVPLRPIGEAMGVNVEWNNSDKMAGFYNVYDEKDAVSWGEVMDTDKDGKDDSFMGASGIMFSLNDKRAASVILFYKFGADIKTAEETYTDGDVIMMDTAAVMKDNRIYAPVKYLAEFYGYTVTWDQKTNTVVLTSKE